MTSKHSTRVRAIFHLSDLGTTFIVAKEWAGDAGEISCEILVNGESLGVKKLFYNFLKGPNRRRDIASYSVMQKLEISDEDECVLVLCEL